MVADGRRHPGRRRRVHAGPVPIRSPPDEERSRVVPVIERLVRELPDVPSPSTRARPRSRAPRSMRAPSIVNDVSAGADPEMFEVVRDAGAGLVLMHMHGEPKTMQDDPSYDDVVAEVQEFLRRSDRGRECAGIEFDRLCVDPGIGFGKTLEHNLALLHDIGAFHRPRRAGPRRAHPEAVHRHADGTEVGERVEGYGRRGRVVRRAGRRRRSRPRREGDGPRRAGRGRDHARGS